jgi:hypothetical protein
VAAPHENSESVRVEDRAAGAMVVGAVDALSRVRDLLDNDELTERITTELRQVGVTIVFFIPAQQGQIPGDRSDSSPTPRLTVPVFAWRKPVGQLHVAADHAAHEDDPMLLRLFAEAVGAIFERNVLAEQLRSANAAARDHVREIYLLSESFGHLEL